MAGMWMGNQSPNKGPPKSSTTNKKSNNPEPNDGSTTMCEHHEQLQRVKFEFELMDGNGIYDIPKLKKLLNQALEHQEGHHV
jgi:hypothetical protein